MKQYLLSMYQPQGDPPPPEVLGPIMQKLGVIRQELIDEGAWVFGDGLCPPETATVLRAKDDDVLVTDAEPDVLTAACPKSVADVEAACGR